MNDVGNYYDKNTRSFLRFGKGQTRAIHRALRAPGVSTIDEAYHVVEELILQQLHRSIDASVRVETAANGELGQIPIVADLGCGVGASIAYLSQRLTAQFVGITLSEVQASIASATLKPVHRVVAGDFAEEPPYIGLLGDRHLSAAYLIESWNHAPDPSRLLTRIAAAMAPGGILAICDDIPREHLFASGAVTARDQRLVSEFRRGWHVKTFLPVSSITELARIHGFEPTHCEDLSGYVVLDRPRDRLVHIAAGLARSLDRQPAADRGPLRSAWWDNIRGGDALQQLEKRGLMSYQLCFFRRE